MITATLLLLITSLFWLIAKMQMNYRKSKLNHSSNVKALNIMMSDLLEIQKGLFQQVRIVDQFSSDYKKTREKLSDEILDFQYELLKNISDK